MLTALISLLFCFPVAVSFRKRQYAPRFRLTFWVKIGIFVANSVVVCDGLVSVLAVDVDCPDIVSVLFRSCRFVLEASVCVAISVNFLNRNLYFYGKPSCDLWWIGVCACVVTCTWQLRSRQKVGNTFIFQKLNTSLSNQRKTIDGLLLFIYKFTVDLLRAVF